jgi:hypothetical protein
MNDFTNSTNRQNGGDARRGEEEEEAPCPNVVITTTIMPSQKITPSPRKSSIFNKKR